MDRGTQATLLFYMGQNGVFLMIFYPENNTMICSMITNNNWYKIVLTMNIEKLCV